MVPEERRRPVNLSRPVLLSDHAPYWTRDRPVYMVLSYRNGFDVPTMTRKDVRQRVRRIITVVPRLLVYARVTYQNPSSHTVTES